MHVSYLTSGCDKQSQIDGSNFHLRVTTNEFVVVQLS